MAKEELRIKLGDNYPYWNDINIKESGIYISKTIQQYLIPENPEYSQELLSYCKRVGKTK